MPENTYDLVFVEGLAHDPRTEPDADHSERTYQVIGCYERGIDGKSQIPTLPPAVYVLYEGKGRVDEHGLPPRFERVGKKFEVKQPDPKPAAVKEVS